MEQNRFIAVFDRDGTFPIEIKFNTAVSQRDGWKSVDFRVAPSVLQPLVLRGLAEDTQFRLAGAARADRKGDDFVTWLASDGVVNLSWQETRPEAEGKLFYAAEMLSQISISPGLLRQTALLDFKVMQGELSRVTLRLHGKDEVTRVQGDQVLAWNVEPVAGSTDRRLVVKLNQPQKDAFAVQVQMQTELGAFPQTAGAKQCGSSPRARRVSPGIFRVVNQGAVRLEVVQSAGLSQISPEQFPESERDARRLLRATSASAAIRLSGSLAPTFALRVNAEQTCCPN